MANKYTPLRCPYCGGKLYTHIGLRKHMARCEKRAVMLVKALAKQAGKGR